MVASFPKPSQSCSGTSKQIPDSIIWSRNDLVQDNNPIKPSQRFASNSGMIFQQILEDKLKKVEEKNDTDANVKN